LQRKKIERKIKLTVRLFLKDEGTDRLAEDVQDVKWKESESTREFELPTPSCCSCCSSPPPKNKITLSSSNFKKEELKGKNSVYWKCDVYFDLPANLSADHILRLPVILQFPNNVEVKFVFSVAVQSLSEGIAASGKQAYAKVRAKIPDWVVQVVKDSVMGLLSNALSALIVL